MKLETFFEKFDQFADAPDAVAKMRELVLELAVQGKLVDQLPSDEPATKLLERIQKSKERLIKERAIRRQETDAIECDSAPFPIPQSWLWTRLGEIGDWGSGSTPPRGNHDLYNGGITWLKSGELNDNLALGGSSETVTELALKTGSFRRNQSGDVLFAMYGATIGKVAILAEPAVTNQAVCGCTPFEGVSNRYLFNYLVSQRAAFHKASEGGAQPNLSKVKIVAFPFPLPPLAEQKRIVAKVDELMALCDRLESQQQEREKQASKLARASLSRFADAPTPANLHFLFHPSYAISPADLRKSILNLAVYGKLAAPVPDDDEIPSIEKFREAAASLATSLGLRSPKESLDEADPPFDVPAHWLWMALADLGAAQTGTTPSKNDHEAFNGDIPFIKPADILPDGIDYSNESLTRYGAKSGSRLAPAGSLLMVCIGTIGKCNLLKRECAFNQQINSLSPVQWVDSQYLFLALRAPYFQDEAWKKSSSTTIAILNKRKWLSIPVPIPPLAEQRRIVAKVEQLMALVDALETQLAASRATAEKLLAAVVAELTEGTHASPAC